MYLETFYEKKYESDRLIGFLKGTYNSDFAKKSEHIEALKMAYVGMSRSSHLLCLALHKDRINGHIDELKPIGWDIILV